MTKMLKLETALVATTWWRRPELNHATFLTFNNLAESESVNAGQNRSKPWVRYKIGTQNAESRFAHGSRHYSYEQECV